MSKERSPMHDKVIEVRWELLSDLVSEVNWLLEDDKVEANRAQDGVAYELRFADVAREQLEAIARVLNPIVDARPLGWQESEEK